MGDLGEEVLNAIAIWPVWTSRLSLYQLSGCQESVEHFWADWKIFGRKHLWGFQLYSPRCSKAAERRVLWNLKVTAYSDTVVKIRNFCHVKSEIIRGLGGVHKRGKSPPAHHGYVYQNKPSSGHRELFFHLSITPSIAGISSKLLSVIEEVSYMLWDVMCLQGCGCTLWAEVEGERRGLLPIR